LLVTGTAQIKPRHRHRPERIDLADGDYLIPDKNFLAQFLAGASYRTGKRLDDQGLPFIIVNGLKYRPVRRGQEWLVSRIKVLGQQPRRHRRR
jgi:hypothetical protein